MSLKLAEGAEDAGLSRNEFMLRELFRDHYALADRFDAGGVKLEQILLRIDGTENSAGLYRLMEEVSTELSQHAGAVNEIRRVIGSMESMLEAFHARMRSIGEDRDVVAAMSRVMSDAACETWPAFVAMQSKLLDSVSMKAFGEAAELKAQLVEQEAMLGGLRKELSEMLARSSASQQAFYEQNKQLSERYNERAEELAESYRARGEALTNRFTAAINRINTQAAGLSIKYAACASIAFVVGHLTHDGLYSYIAKFMQ